jgi:hypothetical protein
MILQLFLIFHNYDQVVLDMTLNVINWTNPNSVDFCLFWL